MEDVEDYDDLNDLLKKNADVLTVTMEELRDIQGVGRLGKYVVQDISDELKQRGIKHLPKHLPLYQSECVRLFRQGTPVERLIMAVNQLKNWEQLQQNHKNDQHIRDVLANDSSDILNRIRSLICE